MDKLPYYEAVICEIYDKDNANCANCEKAPRCTGCTVKFLVAGLELVGCFEYLQKEEIKRMKKRGEPLVFSRESVDALKNMDRCKNE